MKHIAAVLTLLAGLITLAAAQAPPPVPALPDASRLTPYTLSSSTCGCPVNFAIYGDGTDIDNWLQVFIGTSPVLSTDPSFGWALSSPTGSLATIPRPITDAVLTFNAPQSATVTIVGARRPRRISQFSENRGIPARDINQVVTDIVAQHREAWDKLNGALVGQPGESILRLPPAATRANQVLAFNAQGNPTVVAVPASIPTGQVAGPNSSTVGHPATWSNALGTTLADTPVLGVPVGGTGQATLTANGVLIGEGTAGVNVAATGTAGRVLIDQGAGADPQFKVMTGAATINQNGVVSLAGPAATSAPINPNSVMFNGTLVQSQATNAQTFAVKTLAGADPSNGDPVTFVFRNVTAATGNYVLRIVNAPLSITIPAGQGTGFVNATPGRLWIGALDNAGTVELFVINCASMSAGAGVGTNVTGIFPLQGWGIISTSNVSGAANAQIAYSATARSNVPYVPLGYATWEAGGTLATAGTWNVAPTRMQLFQPGSTPLPGTPIGNRQRQVTGTANTGATAFPSANTIPQNTAGDLYMAQAITPTSSANSLNISTQAIFSSSVADNPGMALFQDTTANAIVATYGRINVGTTMWTPALNHLMLAGTLSSTTFKVRAGGNQAGTISFNAGNAVTPIGGGVANSFLQIEEIMD